MAKGSILQVEALEIEHFDDFLEVTISFVISRVCNYGYSCPAPRSCQPNSQPTIAGQELIAAD
jgi:hypothetical protein